jgi:hypothetical protein
MKINRLATSVFTLAFCIAGTLLADQVVMQNGDVLNGSVLSADTNAVTLQNDNLGAVVLPRAKISSINFGTAASSPAPAIATNAPAPDLSQTNSDLSDALRSLRGDTNLVQQVQSQILGSASPDAVKQFNDLLDGLSTGKIDMNGLRQQAQSEADELRSMKKDLGPGDSAEIDSYLAILDDFLQQTTVTNPGAITQTNSTP